jgi:hypothetical protein
MTSLCLNLRKNKFIALKIVRKETNDSFDKESMDEEDLALIVRKFNRLFKTKKGNFRNTYSKFTEKPKDYSSATTIGRREREKNPHGIQCHECGCYGHIWAKCANLQGNAFNITHSDEYDKDDPGKGVNYLAFTTYKSPHESSKYPTPNPHDSSENESEEEDDLQNTYFFFLISK